MARCAVLAAVLPVFAGDAAALRPFDGTDASVAGEGIVELELGPVDWTASEGNHAFAPSATANVGVARGWELSAFVQPSGVIEDEGDRRFELADDGLAVKRVLRDGCLQDAAGPSVALEAALLLPATAPRDRVGARVTPVLSQTWKGFTAHLSTSLYWTRADEPAASGSLIVEGPELPGRIRAGLEATAGWERKVGRGWSGLAALIWRARDDLDLDLGFRLGRVDGATGTELRAGLTWWFRAWGVQAE